MECNKETKQRQHSILEAPSTSAEEARHLREPDVVAVLLCICQICYSHIVVDAWDTSGAIARNMSRLFGKAISINPISQHDQRDHCRVHPMYIVWRSAHPVSNSASQWLVLPREAQTFFTVQTSRILLQSKVCIHKLDYSCLTTCLSRRSVCAPIPNPITPGHRLPSKTRKNQSGMIQGIANEPTRSRKAIQMWNDIRQDCVSNRASKVENERCVTVTARSTGQDGRFQPKCVT